MPAGGSRAGIIRHEREQLLGGGSADLFGGQSSGGRTEARAGRMGWAAEWQQPESSPKVAGGGAAVDAATFTTVGRDGDDGGDDNVRESTAAEGTSSGNGQPGE